MEQIRKYRSFDELKAVDSKKSSVENRMRRHQNFEELIHAIYNSMPHTPLMCKPKKFEWQVIY